MARRPKATELEDVTHLAGWMYADLLLALMVIFLATISFVPRLSSSSAGVTSSSSAQVDLGQNYKLGLALVYSAFEPAKIAEDIRVFKAHESLSGNSQILYAQITGGYSGATETEETGRVRALAFSYKLNRALPDPFTNAPTYLAASKDLKPNEVGLRITFAEKIG
jgi:hypothetical protein